MNKRYRVFVSHGEAASLFHAVDTYQPESEQPAIIHTFSTVNDRYGASAVWLANDFCLRHNNKRV